MQIACAVGIKFAVVGMFNVGKVPVRYSRDPAILLIMVEAAFS